MSQVPENLPADPLRPHRRLAYGMLLLIVLGLSALLLVPSCRGCRKTAPNAEEPEKKPKKPEPDFELGQFVVQPSSDSLGGSYYKPGHWNVASITARVNHFDLLGDLELAAADGDGAPLGLTATGYSLRTFRPVALPKQQTKTLESLLFFPPADRAATISCRIVPRRMGFHGIETQQPMTPMPSYQYRFVVLARWPERYKFLGALASVSPPVTLEDRVRQEPYYRLALFPADKRPPLPAQALCWTSIACLLWDDAPPESLDTDQQRALLDWLHWGGQLIISGPETLDGLEHSFLAPYLPATGAAARPLTAADFSALHAYWTPSARQRPSPPPPFAQPWPGLRLEKHPQARFIPGCGQLLAERRVGCGRVVLSAFHLNGRELVEWAGFDSFFNAALLRRPPRRYRFHDNNLDLRLDWADQRRLRGDPRLVCGLRYFARDTGREFAQLAADVQYGTADDGRTPDGTGVAAWNDFNAVAAAARESLRNAARIEIPDRDFVVWVIAGYLVVLVPLNWLLFRLLGRVEWAWAAAPVIAVACSLVVIRLAQLDIGFVRSHTEIDVLELHGGYPRAHLTRYTALYSSLSTRYSVRQEHDPGGLVQPFPSVAAPSQFRLLPGEELSELTLRRDQELELRGFHVSSNATGLLHSEQMIDLGGAVTLAENPAGGWQIANRTRLTLGPARVVRRSADGSREVAVLATLEPGAVVPAEFHEVALPPPAGKSPAAPAEAGVARGELSVQRILDLAEDLAGLEPGDARLVARCGQPVAGQVVEPVAAQVRFGTVVVAHLTRGFGADPQPDLNLREDVEQKQVP